jgi:ATP-binding cassette subfamily B protein
MTARPFLSNLGRGRRLLIGEVIQASAMDCGPASLKALLEGFHVPVSYGRLREACHTDVDGTSIDTLEELAVQLNLEAEQVMVPVDHVLVKEAGALPAIAVVMRPAGDVHFIVAWRSHGPLVQLMDPARGRLWLTKQAFLQSLYVHTTIVPAEAWRRWAGSEEFLEPLRRRMERVGIPPADVDLLVSEAVTDASWRRLAALDATVRMVASLRRARALRQSEVLGTLSTLFEEACQDPAASTIPSQYWSAHAAARNEDGADQVRLRGAVLVRARGRRPTGREISATSLEVRAALTEAPARPFRDALLALRADGLLGPAAAACALTIAVVGVLLEAVLLRSVLDAGTFLRVPEQALGAGLILTAFAVAMLVLEFALGSAERRAGRGFETRLRAKFLEKIPRLADSYFRSRLVSDMAERSHDLHVLRTLPQLGVRALRIVMEIVVTTLAIAWLDPESAGLAVMAAVAAAAIPVLGHSMLAERDLRVRTHEGALSRFHLDALLGRTAIDAHGAAGTIEREHESLLQEWIRAYLSLQRGSVTIEGVQMLVGFGVAAWVLFGQFAGGNAGATLLLAYWVLNLPTLGYELAMLAREYPARRSTLLRLLEPLGAPEAVTSDMEIADAVSGPGQTAAARIDASRVSVRAAGHEILEGIEIHIAPASHVAIVGPSGAGKSTLVGLLLGWSRPASGQLLVDGRPLFGGSLDKLRSETAWVDPTVQVWNRSLLENLLYGSEMPQSIGPVLEAAGLTSVVAKLPNGLATLVGEGGALLSAGEAQRVRLARAMLRHRPRLVILDEPFMGLERERRRALLSDIRQRWSAATLLYVTHEVSEARAFDRVLVLERGRLVEDGDPRILAQTTSSRFRRLLQAQEAVHARFGAGAEWRRLRVQDGRIHQDLANATIEQTA